MKNSGWLVRTLGKSVLLTSIRSTEAERSPALLGSRFLLTLIVLLGSVSMIPAEYKCFRFLLSGLFVRKTRELRLGSNCGQCGVEV